MRVKLSHDAGVLKGQGSKAQKGKAIHLILKAAEVNNRQSNYKGAGARGSRRRNPGYGMDIDKPYQGDVKNLRCPRFATPRGARTPPAVQLPASTSRSDIQTSRKVPTKAASAGRSALPKSITGGAIIHCPMV